MVSARLAEQITNLATAMRLENPGWRVGQSLFNALHLIEPDLANTIRATSVDPFYDESRVNAFMECVTNWIPNN